MSFCKIYESFTLQLILKLVLLSLLGNLIFVDIKYFYLKIVFRSLTFLSTKGITAFTAGFISGLLELLRNVNKRKNSNEGLVTNGYWFVQIKLDEKM